MKNSSPYRVCFLLPMCIPASFLCVVWLPLPAQEYLLDHADGACKLLKGMANLLRAWPQYFVVQTLSALLAACALKAYSAYRQSGVETKKEEYASSLFWWGRSSSGPPSATPGRYGFAGLGSVAYVS